VTGDRDTARRIKNILDPVQVLDVERLVDIRPFKRRYNTQADNPLFHGAHADFVLPEHSRTPGDSHFSAYSIHGPCPTLTTTPTVIFDPRDGVNTFRRLSPREGMRAQGFDDSFSFPTTLKDQDIYSAIGKGMDIHCLCALGRQIDNYLRGSTAPLAPLVCSYTSSEKAEMIHCSLGHPSDDVTRKMGYPTI
jgi:hypothetical protein